MKTIKPSFRALTAVSLLMCGLSTWAADSATLNNSLKNDRHKSAAYDEEARPDGEHDDHQGMDPHRPDHQPFDKILSLTDDQKKTLENARMNNQSAMRELHQQLRRAHTALNQAIDTNATDAEVTQRANDFAALVAQQEIHRATMRKQLMSVLTDEQKQRLTAWESEHQQHTKHPVDVDHKRDAAK